MVNNKETWTGDKLFTYVRYDPDVSPMGLGDLDLDDINPRNVQVMDSVEHIKDIQKVGATYADKYIDLNHLGSFT
jgi:hypothetical protein